MVLKLVNLILWVVNLCESIFVFGCVEEVLLWFEWVNFVLIVGEVMEGECFVVGDVDILFVEDVLVMLMILVDVE